MSGFTSYDVSTLGSDSGPPRSASRFSASFARSAADRPIGGISQTSAHQQASADHDVEQVSENPDDEACGDHQQ